MKTVSDHDRMVGIRLSAYSLFDIPSPASWNAALYGHLVSLVELDFGVPIQPDTHRYWGLKRGHKTLPLFGNTEQKLHLHICL